MPALDGDFSVYDRIVDRAAHADGSQHRLGIKARADKLEPAAVDQKQVAAFAGRERSNVISPQRGRALPRSPFSECHSRGRFAAGVEAVQKVRHAEFLHKARAVVGRRAVHTEANGYAELKHLRDAQCRTQASYWRSGSGIRRFRYPPGALVLRH